MFQRLCPDCTQEVMMPSVVSHAIRLKSAWTVLCWAGGAAAMISVKDSDN